MGSLHLFECLSNCDSCFTRAKDPAFLSEPSAWQWIVLLSNLNIIIEKYRPLFLPYAPSNPYQIDDYDWTKVIEVPRPCLDLAGITDEKANLIIITDRLSTQDKNGQN
jgi:hypothetical protein